jgi:AraC-like DNA-binding protein
MQDGMFLRKWSGSGLQAELISAPRGVTLVDHTHDAPHAIVLLCGHFSDDGRPYEAGEARISPGGDRHFVRFDTAATCLLITAMDDAVLPALADRWSGRLRFLPDGFVATGLNADCSRLSAELVTAIARERDDLMLRQVPSWLRELRRRMTVGREIAGPAARTARCAGVSREHLTRSCRRHFGTSFSTFRMHQRVAEAVRLLRHTSAHLAEIAFVCGFSDQSHMTRAFVRCLGRTPGVLRLSSMSQMFKPAPTPASTLSS